MESAAITGLRNQILGNARLLIAHSTWQPPMTVATPMTNTNVEVVIYGCATHFTALLVFGHTIAVEGGSEDTIVRALENLLLATAALMEVVNFEVSFDRHRPLRIEGVRGGRLNCGIFTGEVEKEIEGMHWFLEKSGEVESQQEQGEEEEQIEVEGTNKTNEMGGQMYEGEMW